MHFGDRLKILRERKGYTQEQLGELIGAAKTTISNYESGKREPDVEKIKKLARVLDTTGDELLGTGIKGSLPMLDRDLSSEDLKIAWDYKSLDFHGRRMVQLVVEEEQTRMKDEASKAARTVPEKIVRFRVPEYSHPMSAGTGVEADLEFPNDLELVKAPPRGTSYVAHVTGNSMEPDFHDGDMVFVHAVEEIPVGRIGVFLMNGQQWVKELGHGVLISHNRDYDPIAITDGTRCQGLVIGLCDSSYFEA